MSRRAEPGLSPGWGSYQRQDVGNSLHFAKLRFPLLKGVGHNSHFAARL